MILSDHAKTEMEHSNISEKEIRQCLEYGKVIIKQLVKNEMRYGKEIDLKDRTIVIIYTYFNDEEKIITTYPIRRKKQWQN